jgi:hypothetical protein
MSNTKFVLEATAATVLEESQSLSRSLLWQVQRKFYETQGVEAWRQGIVPHYITSNTYIAKAYTNLVFAFLRDCRAVTHNDKDGAFPGLDFSQPVYIVELGAGSGHFAYHFLKKLSSFLPQSALKDVPVQYIMTDFAERTVDYWHKHASFKPFIDAGLLDFALYDAAQPAKLSLTHSKKILTTGTIANPLVVIANYFFDSVPQDLFSVQDGKLLENLITISSPQPEPDLGAPGLLDRIDIAYKPRLPAENHYDDPNFNRILQIYQRQLSNTIFTFPSTGLRCIQDFNEMAGGRLLLLSADKGYTSEESLVSLSEPGLNLHGESFSMMVNYHAIAEYITLLGGEALLTSHRHTNLCITAFCLGKPPQGYLETRQSFREVVEDGGPDDFFTLKKGIEPHYDSLSLEQLLAYLRLSGWDANIFLGSFPTLLNHIASLSTPLRQELYRAIQQIWGMYYPIGEEGDLPFRLAMLLQAMLFYPEALEFYERSLQLYGYDASTFYNMGICHYNLREMEAGLASIERALELDPEFEAAKAMRIKFQSELSNRA